MANNREIFVVRTVGGWAVEIDGERLGSFPSKSAAVGAAIRALENVERECLAIRDALPRAPAATVH